MQKEIELYYNPKVLQFLDISGKVKVFKGGRGCGKTRSIPEDILDRAHELPRARIFLASTTFNSIDDNIMPDLREVFRLHGLVEDEDFVVDKHPPAWFERPYKEIEDPRNSIHLFNGFAIQKVSFGRNVKKYRGRSFDGGIIDEALNIDGADFDSILMPTLRGFDYWDDNPYWKMLSIYSSHPRTPEGSWFLRYEKLAELHPDLYGWVEATAFDNLPVLGEDYIEDQRASLSYIEFNIEIMNKGQVKDLPSLFYYQHNANRHHYRTEHMEDVQKELPLALSFDFGGRYSCLTVSQSIGNEERIVHEFDTNNLTPDEVKAGRVKKVPHIVEDFCRKFHNHPTRRIELWGDRTGLNRQEMDDRNLYEQIEEILIGHRWQVEIMAAYDHSALHKSRWSFMNTCFEESIEDYPVIRINSLTCPNLIMSLDMTQITDDFKKNKASERNSHFNQSHAPHFTDTLDYKIFNKYFYLLDDDFGYIPSGLDGGIDTF
jgi:hypothetical protein